MRDLLDESDILVLYDAEMRQNPPTFMAQVMQSPGLTVCVSEVGQKHGGWVLYTRLDENNADAAIRAQIARFAELGREFEWKVYSHDTPADLKDRLLAHGFESEEPEALLALDLEHAPTYLWQPVTADVRRITTSAQFDDLATVLEEVWNEPFSDLRQELERDRARAPQLLSVYAAYVDDAPATSAWIRFHEGRSFADLWGGSTVSRFRGRGLYTALVAVRAQEAHTRGVRFLTVDASPMSRPILEKLGFRFLCYSQPFVWRPPST